MSDKPRVPLDDKLTELIIQAIIRVHQTLGPGFLETVYHRSLVIELQRLGIQTSAEHDVTIHYEGQPVGHHRIDLIVEGRVIVELKTVEALSRAHYAQVRSYLKATGLRVGLLVNFASFRADYRRIELIQPEKEESA